MLLNNVLNSLGLLYNLPHTTLYLPCFTLDLQGVMSVYLTCSKLSLITPSGLGVLIILTVWWVVLQAALMCHVFQEKTFRGTWSPLHGLYSQFYIHGQNQVTFISLMLYRVFVVVVIVFSCIYVGIDYSWLKMAWFIISLL